MSSTDRPVEEKEEAPREVPQLGALEEDDEFEEFPENGVYCLSSDPDGGYTTTGFVVYPSL